jgi:hypothetical protein
MIGDFEQWNANIGELSELQELAGQRVGIEAADYLAKRILNHPRAKEPLVPALGGLPLALQQHIEEDLDTLKREGIQAWFVFSGLDITKQDSPFRQKQDQAAINANAWNLYDSHQAEASVAKFGESSEWADVGETASSADRTQHMSRPKTSTPRSRPSSQNESFASPSHHTAHGPRYNRRGRASNFRTDNT